MGCDLSSELKCSKIGSDILGGRKFKTHYRLGRKIGSGASAQVRLCYHNATNKEHVVKIIAKPYSKKDIELEIDLLKQVGTGASPYVVMFVDYFEDNRYYYSIMEYCSGGDMFSVLAQKNKVTEVVLAEWFRQILEGTAHIHLLGIVHRDMKAQNFVFRDEHASVIKIIDFGLGYPMNHGKLLDEPCGAPEYLPPEMILGRYGRKVDIWSIGVLCYITLFGRTPFVSSSDSELFRAIVEKEPNYIVEHGDGRYNPSPEAVSFCKMLLQKNSRARPTAIEALKHVWLQGTVGMAAERKTSDNVEIPSSICESACKETVKIEERDRLRQEESQRLTSHSSRTKSFRNLRHGIALLSFNTAAAIRQGPSLSHTLRKGGNKFGMGDDLDRCTRVNVIHYSSLREDIAQLRISDCRRNDFKLENDHNEYTAGSHAASPPLDP